MAYWNHFANEKYEPVYFCALAVGEKFRMDKFINKRRRSDIVMVKDGEREYHELISKKKHTFAISSVEVKSYDKRLILTKGGRNNENREGDTVNAGGLS